MKEIFATIGFMVCFLAAMGLLGMGHFRLSYSVQEVVCTPKVTPNQPAYGTVVLYPNSDESPYRDNLPNHRAVYLAAGAKP